MQQQQLVEGWQMDFSQGPWRRLFCEMTTTTAMTKTWGGDYHHRLSQRHPIWDSVKAAWGEGGGRYSTTTKWSHIRVGRDVRGGWWLVLVLGFVEANNGHRGYDYWGTLYRVRGGGFLIQKWQEQGGLPTTASSLGDDQFKDNVEDKKMTKLWKCGRVWGTV